MEVRTKKLLYFYRFVVILLMLSAVRCLAGSQPAMLFLGGHPDNIYFFISIRRALSVAQLVLTVRLFLARKGLTSQLMPINNP